MRFKMEKFVKETQLEIVQEIEKVDGLRFRKDSWERKEGKWNDSIIDIWQEEKGK